jgi:hypothetical protein
LRRSLDAYSRFAGTSEWSIGHKLDLYAAGRRAFAGGERAAFEQVYGSLRKYWQVFRPDRPEVCWGWERVYDTLVAELGAYKWAGGMDLVSFAGSGKRHDLALSLQAFSDLKPNEDYPDMAVSKFCHFYNPALFPIYDTTVVYEKAWPVFGKDFVAHCGANNLDPQAPGAGFLANYVSWASSLISPDASRVMDSVVAWLADELPPKVFRTLDDKDLRRLYATAFEFVLIGAAVSK